MLVVVFAGVLRHSLRGNDYLHDAGLHHGACTIHARHDIHVDGAAFGGGAGPRRIADGVALGMFDPEILGWPDKPFRYVVANSAGEGVIARGTDFVVRSNDYAANLRVGVF